MNTTLFTFATVINKFPAKTQLQYIKDYFSRIYSENITITLEYANDSFLLKIGSIQPQFEFTQLININVMLKDLFNDDLKYFYIIS